MKILVGWDDPQEAALLELYLSAGEHEAKAFLDADELKAQVREGGWDVIFLAMTFPKTAEDGYAVFAELQDEPTPLPVVLGCRATEMMGLVKFLTHGLRFYLIRDDRGDFVFLALLSLESAVTAVAPTGPRNWRPGCAKRWTAFAGSKSRSSRKASVCRRATASRPVTSRPRSPSSATTQW